MENLKTYEGFFSNLLYNSKNPNNKIVEDLIEYVKNNDIKKYSKLGNYGIVNGFYIKDNSKRDISDPFGEEVGKNDKKIELMWNPYEEYCLKINGKVIDCSSQKLLKQLSNSIDQK